MKHIQREVNAAHLTGQEKTYYFLEKEYKENKMLDDRPTEEIINEDGEYPAFLSPIYHRFQ